MKNFNHIEKKVLVEELGLESLKTVIARTSFEKGSKIVVCFGIDGLKRYDFLPIDSNMEKHTVFEKVKNLIRKNILDYVKYKDQEMDEVNMEELKYILRAKDYFMEEKPRSAFDEIYTLDQNNEVDKDMIVYAKNHHGTLRDLVYRDMYVACIDGYSLDARLLNLKKGK